MAKGVLTATHVAWYNSAKFIMYPDMVTRAGVIVVDSESVIVKGFSLVLSSDSESAMTKLTECQPQAKTYLFIWQIIMED